MRVKERRLARVANAVHDRLSKCETPRIELSRDRWDAIQELSQKAEFCRRRGYRAALAHVNADLRWLLSAMRSDCQNHEDRLVKLRERSLPSLSEVFHDLLALENEFGEVVCDLKKGTLSVTTLPIQFEDVKLGRFEIRLAYRQLDGDSAYRVIALEPNRASGDERVTHPHVMADELCEGDGQSSVHSALNDGRLHDFFLIVSRLLATYGRGHAYVELDRWGSATCRDCGARNNDERNCDRCGADLCSECGSRCDGCSDLYCASCLKHCRRCNAVYCPGCADCLVGELCPDCRGEEPEETQDDDRTPHDDRQATDGADANAENSDCRARFAVQPDRLGEVAVSA
jgi:hypothetical protein